MITIKDIARKTQVSIGTVDRVLHGRGRVAKKTEEKILALVKKTGYKTNIHGRNLVLKKTFHFGIIMPQTEQDSRYWEILYNGIEQAIADLSAFNIKAQYFFFDKYSEPSFSQAASKALKSKVSGLLIAPVLSDASAVFAQSVPAEIPYVYVDSTVPGTKPLAYIGQNSFQSGVCAAKLMHMLVGAQGSVAVIRILPADFHIDERAKGFSSFFNKVPGISVHTFDASGGMTQPQFIDCIGSIKTDIPQCKGFFVTNAMTHRVVNALQTVADGTIHVIGYDLVDENRRLLADGRIDFIISQKTREQGYQGIYTLFRRLILKEECAKEILMPIEIITAENLLYYQ
jgi:ABC-type sugar transport system, periplasmic component